MRFFQVASKWASDPNMGRLEEFEDELPDYPSHAGEIGHLIKAIRLLKQVASGADVKAEAEKAIASGVSRTYFALVLLADTS